MKATIEEFLSTRLKLHSLWDTDPEFAHMVQTYFKRPVMILTPRPKEGIGRFPVLGNGASCSGIQKRDTSILDDYVPMAFREPAPEELAGNDPSIYGMLAFLKPTWANEYDFIDMMAELAGIRDCNGKSLLGVFQEFTLFTGMPGIHYEKRNNGDFLKGMVNTHGEILSVLRKYGISRARVCLAYTKVLDTPRYEAFLS